MTEKTAPPPAPRAPPAPLAPPAPPAPLALELELVAAAGVDPDVELIADEPAVELVDALDALVSAPPAPELPTVELTDRDAPRAPPADAPFASRPDEQLTAQRTRPIDPKADP